MHVATLKTDANNHRILTLADTDQVTIHCIAKRGATAYTLVVGPDSLGPRGGRNGRWEEGIQILPYSVSRGGVPRWMEQMRQHLIRPLCDLDRGQQVVIDFTALEQRCRGRGREDTGRGR